MRSTLVCHHSAIYGTYPCCGCQREMLIPFLDREFPAEPGERCLFCPLKSECQPDERATDEEIEALFV